MAKKGGMFESLLGSKESKPGNPPPPDMGDEEGYDMPPDFEDEAVAAFPDLEGSPERIEAFWRAVKACVGG